MNNNLKSARPRNRNKNKQKIKINKSKYLRSKSTKQFDQQLIATEHDTTVRRNDDNTTTMYHIETWKEHMQQKYFPPRVDRFVAI